jgi:secretion/DNA translocation related TadE-like protein
MSPGRAEEEGFATVAAVALIGLMLTVALVAAGITALIATHRKASVAADLGALAGATAARSGEAPCDVAARIVNANGATVMTCTVAEDDVLLTVRARPPGALSGLELRARARAGPGPP